MNQVRIMELRGTYKGGGGPDKTILLSAARHNKNDFFILVTYLRDPDDKDFKIGQMAEFYGVKDYVEVMDRSMLDLKCIVTLNKLIRNNSIDIIHAHDEKSTLLGFLLKFLNPGIQIMYTAHGWAINTNQDQFRQKIQFLILKFYTLHIAVSNATRKLMIKSCINKEKIHVLYNSIDTMHWNKGRGVPALRNEYNISEDTFVVGTVGRLCPEKDLPTFLKVARKILNKFPQTVFFIVGDGMDDIVDELKRLVSEMGLGRNIIFTGHRSDLLNIYSSFNVFLMTSITEGMPNTVLEAMAFEVPVVCTDVGGVSELIEDKKNGLLYSPGDVDGLFCGVSELLENSATRIQLGKEGRENVVRSFEFGTRLIKIEKIYTELKQKIN